MELNGALSNPCTPGLLERLAALHSRLKAANRGYPTPRPLRRRPQPLLEIVRRILEEADGPLHAREIHARAEEILGQRVSWSSMKDRLSVYSGGDRPRFRRVRRGWYAQTAGPQRA